MIKIILTFTSKNLKSFKKFLIFLNFLLLKIKVKTQLNFVKKKKSAFSILKSPHVNKKAQDQFLYIKYSKNYNLCTTHYKKLFILIKKLNFRLFSDVKIKIRINLNENYNKYTHLKVFNPSNYKLNVFHKILKLKLIKNFKKKKIKYKKYFSLVSSVG